MTRREEYFSGTIEVLSREQLDLLQEKRLREQISYVHSNSPFYRRRMDEAGVAPHGALGMDDLQQMPVTTKEDLRESLSDHPPFGDFLAVDTDRVARIHFSSGTTGVPTPMMWTASDLDRWSELYARFLWAQGIRPGDRVQIAYSYAWFVGGLGTTAAIDRIGATVIPAGSGDTDRQLDTVRRYGTTRLICTPSFASYLAERADATGQPVSKEKVRSVHVGGEPGASLEATRRRVEQAWGARCYDCYGSLEFQPIAWECEEQSGPHLAEDAFLAEVLDRDTHKAVEPGNEGVLVLTHLDRQAAPLVRWWTGDVVSLDAQPCPCGRTHARLAGGVRGRADDMIIVKGVNVFPTAVEQAVRSVDAAGSEFRIVVPADRRTVTALRVLVEPAGTEVDRKQLEAELRRAIRNRVGVRPEVEVLDPGRLLRSTHKATRLIDATEWSN